MRPHEIQYSQGEWNEHVIRKCVNKNRNAYATEIYKTMINDHNVSCLKGPYNEIKSELKQDIKNNVPASPIIDGSNHICFGTRKKKLSIYNNYYFNTQLKRTSFGY